MSVTRKEVFMLAIIDEKINILEELFSIAKDNDLFILRQETTFEEEEFRIKYNLNIQLLNAFNLRLNEPKLIFRDLDLKEVDPFIFTENIIGNGFLEFQPHQDKAFPSCTPFWISSEGIEICYSNDELPNQEQEPDEYAEELREIRDMFLILIKDFVEENSGQIIPENISNLLDFYIDYSEAGDGYYIFQIMQCSKLYGYFENFEISYSVQKRKSAETLHIIERIKELISYTIPCNYNELFHDFADGEYAYWLFVCGYFDGYYECSDVSNINVFLCYICNLIDLYIFKLDKKYNFLPKEFKNGERLIYPNFEQSEVMKDVKEAV